MSIPEGLERRKLRLAAIGAAKAQVEARAQERLEREQGENQSKLATRVEHEKRTARSRVASHAGGEADVPGSGVRGIFLIRAF
jgi:hypothetical protein